MTAKVPTREVKKIPTFNRLPLVAAVVVLVLFAAFFWLGVT